MKPSATSAVVLFGSVARRDADAMSDRDLLLVHDGDQQVHAKKKRLEGLGWSCTTYTWARLERMAAQGSLFLQHLRVEGNAIADPGSRFRDTVQGTRIRSSYEDLVTSSLDLVQLLELIPDGRFGGGWAADVLSVAARSLMVARLAHDGEFVFSTEGLAHASGRRGWIRDCPIRTIQSMRAAKRLHRTARHGAIRRDGEIQQWLKDLRPLLGGCPPTKTATSGQLLSAIDEPPFTGWYPWSRLVEAFAISATPQPGSIGEFRRQRREILRLVSAPTEYGWRFAAHRGEVRAMVEALKEMAVLN